MKLIFMIGFEMRKIRIKFNVLKGWLLIAELKIMLKLTLFEKFWT